MTQATTTRRIVTPAATLNVPAPVVEQRPSGNGNFERASAFVNIYLPRKDGTRARLGNIALVASKAEHVQLMEWLAKDPANIDKLKERLVLDFNQVNNSPDASLLDLD